MLNRLTAEAAGHHARTGYPLITLSYAQSLDGCLTPWPGRQVNLSGEESKTLTHRVRAAHDAILIGVGTMLADNPRLTARRVGGPHPVPIILDSRLRTPLDALIFNEHPQTPLIATTKQASATREESLRRTGAELIRVEADEEGRVNISALFFELGQRGLKSVMVEGGSGIITALLAANMVDRLIVTIAPIFSGGLHLVGDLPFKKWGEFPRFDVEGMELAGKDMIIWGRFKKPEVDQ